MKNSLDKIRALIVEAEQADTTKKLPDFIRRYVSFLPDYLDAIYHLTRDAGIYENIKPLLTIATDYFLSPQELLERRSQLRGHTELSNRTLLENQSPMELLLDDAYLAHRLLEEVNDRFMTQCGIPLMPVEMTMANVIAHELIGEPFANQLDQAVLVSVELVFNDYQFSGNKITEYVINHKKNGWAKELEAWPCLAESLTLILESGK